METVKTTSAVFGEVRMDAERIAQIRRKLADGYTLKDKAIIAQAAAEVRAYVDSGLDDEEVYSEAVDDYTGHDAGMLARQYICHVFLDHYLDDDADQEYINTGLKPYMRQWHTAPVQLSFNF